MKRLRLGALAVVLLASSGCAMITGTIAGPITGAIDLPAETHRQNLYAYADNPMMHGVGAVVLVPVGIVIGPVCGLVKGLSLDIQWSNNMISYHEVFCEYGAPSVWRPFTFHWPSRLGGIQR